MGFIVLFEENKGRELDYLPSSISEHLSDDTLLWIDLSPEDSILEDIVKELSLSSEAADALRKPTPKPNLTLKQEHIHLTVFAPDSEAEEPTVALECVVGRNWVITSHRESIELLKQFLDPASDSGSVGRLDGASFLSTLLRWIIDGYRGAFEKIETELEEFGDRLLRGNFEAIDDQVEELVRFRSQIGALRRKLVSHRSSFLALAQPELAPVSSSESASHFQDLSQEIENALKTASDVRDLIGSSFDVLIARSEHRTNQIVKLLTLISLMLLPGALIAGIMGMNFKPGLFDNPDNFWIVTAVIVAIMALTMVLAKMRKWL